VAAEALLTRLMLQLVLDTLGRPPDVALNQAIDRLIEIERGGQ
jgi:hypothetical protein